MPTVASALFDALGEVLAENWQPPLSATLHVGALTGESVSPMSDGLISG